MRVYSQKAVDFLGTQTVEEFVENELANLAISRLVEIVGEAATHIKPEFREATKTIPWKKIIGSRIILAHAYMRVDLDVIYQIVKNELPELISQLNKVLENEHDHDT